MMSETPSRRYPGVQPFGPEQQHLFFGRDQDIADLLRLISMEKLIVMFGKSGYGKSSLLNAGILPKLGTAFRQKTCIPVPVRFGNYEKGRSFSPKETLLTQLALVCDYVPGTEFYERMYSGKTLWQEFKRRQKFAPSVNNRQSEVFVLLFDQFEEFFLYPPEQQTQFREQLSELLYTEIPQAAFHEFGELNTAQQEHLSEALEVHVVFAIRSDRMSYLDSMKLELPAILHKRYELKGLSQKQAREAITGPASAEGKNFVSAPFRFQPGALSEILQNLSQTDPQLALGTDLPENKLIETFQLQIICQSIENGVIEKNRTGITDVEITAIDLPDFSKIYETYYLDRIRSLNNPEKEKTARLLVEEELLFVDESKGEGRRLSVDGDVLATNLRTKHHCELPDGLLNELVNSFLVRRESTARGIYYEISHDTLVKPILVKYRERKQKEEQHLRLERIEAEKQEYQREAEAKMREYRRKAIGFIRANSFYLGIGLVIVMLLFDMIRGQELLIDVGAYPGFRVARILFAFFLMSMAIWLLPLPFFPKHSKADFDRLRLITGQNLYLGLFVSSLPMILYFVFILIYLVKLGFTTWFHWLLVGIMIAAGVFGVYWVIRHSKFKTGRVQFWMCMNWMLAFILFWSGKEVRVVFWNYYFVGMCMFIQIVLLGSLLKNLENQYQNGNHKIYRRYYRSVFVVTIIGTFGLSLTGISKIYDPLFVLIFIINIYMLIVNLIIAGYSLIKNKWLKYNLTLILTLFVWFIFFRRTEIHHINYVRSDLRAEDTRVAFRTYFEQWYLSNISPNVDLASTEDIPIFLVAAQGGDSRAGLWTSHVLNRLEIESDYKFHRHLFAVTSASGGSAGMGATLAFWRYAQDHPEIDPITRRNMHAHFAPTMFGLNYLSPQLTQLFVNEVGQRFVSLVKKDVFDRNVEHQLQETLGFAKAIRFGFELNDKGEASPLDRFAQSFEKGNGDTLDIGKYHPKIINYPMLPYLSYWYTSNGQPDPRLPLYFPVTTNIQSGKSGYASAIAWDSTLFLDAIDIVRDAEKNKPGKSLALVTTTNLSQLVPGMNAYTYIEDVGNFMDGGVFEDMGLMLMSRIHTRLKEEIVAAPDSVIPPSIKQRLKIKILFLINEEIDIPSGTKFDDFNQITATFRVFSASGLNRSTWWLSYFHLDLPPEERPIELVLQGPYTPYSEWVPLGRWLSRRSVDIVCRRVETIRLDEILDHLGN